MRQPKPTVDRADAQERAREAYGQLGVSFEENRGQADKRVRFLARHGGANVFLTDDAAWFVLSGTTKGGASGAREVSTARGSGRVSGRHNPPATAGGSDNPLGMATEELATKYAVRMKIEGANPQAEVVGENKLEGRVNYFRGNDPAKWQRDVPTYGTVRYREIYKGVDLVYYGNEQREMEYDFRVAPGADAGQISLRFTGAEELRVDASGDLVIKTPAGEMRQRKPVVYQETEDGGRVEIASGYAVKRRGRVGFAIGEYDESRALVIDPVLVYSTYLGSSFGEGIAVGSAGNAYVTGTAGLTAFVTKLNADGSGLIYSTFIDATNAETYSESIAVDAAGNAYIIGELSLEWFSPRMAHPAFPRPAELTTRRTTAAETAS